MGVGWGRRERNKLKFNFHLKAQSFPIQEHTNWDEAQQNHWRPIDLAIKWWILPMKCISIEIELSSCVWPYFINKSKVPREWHFGRNKSMLLICSSNIFVNETDDYIQIAPTIDANLSHTHNWRVFCPHNRDTSGIASHATLIFNQWCHWMECSSLLPDIGIIFYVN